MLNADVVLLVAINCRVYAYVQSKCRVHTFIVVAACNGRVRSSAGLKPCTAIN